MPQILLRSLLALTVLAGTPALADEDPTGVWDLTVEWTEGPAQVTLTVRREQRQLVAIWSGPRGTLEARDVRFEHPILIFVLDVTDTSGIEVPLRYQGSLSGNEIDAVLEMPGGRRIEAGGRRANAADER